VTAIPSQPHPSSNQRQPRPPTSSRQAKFSMGGGLPTTTYPLSRAEHFLSHIILSKPTHLDQMWVVF
jgi:hypothetical protein